MYSLVVPVYRNEGSLAALLDEIGGLNERLNGELEAVFVVDGSPDRSYAILRESLPHCPFRAQLLTHSRNFGSFAAIRSGLSAAKGEYMAVMAADLQEPIGLAEKFFTSLSRDEADIAVGTRVARADPLGARIASGIFWWLYRKLVQPDIPRGGVDVFACNRQFRDELLALGESNSSLIGQLFWLGMRRIAIPYERLPRQQGRSAWSLSRKLKYLMDSLFAFSDLPIHVLLIVGSLGIAVAVALGTLVVIVRLLGIVGVPGYAMTIVTLVFFGGLNTFGLGLIGAYVWRAYENTKQRPLSVVQSVKEYEGTAR